MQFYKGKRFAVFRNFRVISMRFAVFLCYSVRYLYVFLCGFAVFVPPLRPPSMTKNASVNNVVREWRQVTNLQFFCLSFVIFLILMIKARQTWHFNNKRQKWGIR